MTRWRCPSLRVLFCALFICGVPSALHAGDVRCPVCGTEYPDSIEECPNDGTNLLLEGKKVAKPAPVDTDSASAVEKTEPDEVKKSTGDAPGQYTRQDKGGTRRRASSVDEEDDAASAERSDRRRRIGPERRGPEENKDDQKIDEEQARLAREAFAAKDDQLRTAYEKKRDSRERESRIRAEEAESERRGAAALRWTSLWAQGAPITSIGLRLWWMGEGDAAGPVTGAELDVNFLREKARVGLSTFMGVRVLPERGDLMFLETVHVGFQYPWRYSPWVVGRAGIGAMVENRFGSDLTQLVRAVGVEAGVDCRIQPSLVLTPSVGFMRFAVSDVGWNSVVLKFSIGF